MYIRHVLGQQSRDSSLYTDVLSCTCVSNVYAVPETCTAVLLSCLLVLTACNHVVASGPLVLAACSLELASSMPPQFIRLNKGSSRPECKMELGCEIEWPKLVLLCIYANTGVFYSLCRSTSPFVQPGRAHLPSNR